MSNTFVFERRVIYWENTWVDADDMNEAREKLRNGEADECQLEGFEDYYDDDYTFVESLEPVILDPLVDMVKQYGLPEQLELLSLIHI